MRPVEFNTGSKHDCLSIRPTKLFPGNKQSKFNCAILRFIGFLATSSLPSLILIFELPLHWKENISMTTENRHAGIINKRCYQEKSGEQRPLARPHANLGRRLRDSRDSSCQMSRCAEHRAFHVVLLSGQTARHNSKLSTFLSSLGNNFVNGKKNLTQGCHP